MSRLLDYLNAWDRPLAELAQHFRDKFGVTVIQEQSLYLFKYQHISANWDEPITQECRGTIVQHRGIRIPTTYGRDLNARTRHAWQLRSRPFDKFFNQHEGRCPLFGPEDFAAFTPELAMHEKADGTCIQLWWDPAGAGRWRASTLGTITPHLVNEEAFTFEELFWRTCGFGGAHLETLLDKTETYLFELCCDVNRLVTKYEHDHCMLLGIRNTLTGDYHDLHGGHALAVCEGTNTRLPHHVPFKEAGITRLEEAQAFIERESVNPRYGEWPEGFVLYHQGAPIAKMKNATYLQLHHVGGGDIGHSKNKIVEAYFMGTLDDIYTMLTDRLAKFADDLQAVAGDVVRGALHTIHTLSERDYEAQKDFALAVNALVPQSFRGFCFRNKALVVAGSPELDDALNAWLCENYAKFNWKELVVSAAKEGTYS